MPESFGFLWEARSKTFIASATSSRLRSISPLRFRKIGLSENSFVKFYDMLKASFKERCSLMKFAQFEA